MSLAGSPVLPLSRFRVVLLASAALVALAICPATARADKSQVRAVLDRMQAAVLKGDKAAYLELVDRTDPVFLKEQENWAADFDHHVPTAFTLAMKDDEGVFFWDVEAKFDLTTEWTMGEDVPGAPQRKLTFPVVFQKVDEKWLYRGEDWQTLAAPGMDGAGGAKVFYFDGSQAKARTIADVLPEVRVHVDKGFSVAITRVQDV